MKQGSYIFRAIRMIRSASGKILWGSIILTILQGILPLLFIYLIKMVVDGVTKAGLDHGESGRMSMFFLLVLLFGCFLVYFLNVAIGSWSSVVREDLSARVGRKMYHLLHEKSTSLDMVFFEDPAYHDLFHRASRDITYRPNRITGSLLQLLQSCVSLTLLAFLLIYIHWAVAVVLFLAAIPSMIVRVRYSREYFKWNRENIRTERFMNYFHHILTGEAFAKEIRLFGLASYFTKRFDENHNALKQSRLAMSRRRMWGEIMANLFSSILVFGSLAFIILGTTKGNISIGSVVLYFLAFQRGLGFLREATGSLGNLYEDRLFLDDLFSFLSLEPHRKTVIQTVGLKGTGSISLKNVTYVYPGSESNAIKNLSITLEAGKHYALVGENGAGKSTLVKLLCGLYQPVSGELRLDGVNYNDIPQQELLRNFSALFQDFVLYYLTAGENIRFGDPEKPATKEELDFAAKEAGIDELLRTFSQGWDTSLGRIMDGGRQLSMGEWQKIALARAFYRDAPILLLDEPGSAVDARAEAAFIEKFHDLTRGKTTLIISHRLSAVRNTDLIFVLHQGSLVESGTHDELMVQNGKYAELFNLQASSYL